MLYKTDIDRISVSLWINGFECSPEEITRQLGVQPSETRIKGEKRFVSKKAKAPMINKENSWRLKSELPQTVEPDKHLEFLLKQLNPHKKAFLELTKKYETIISFGIDWNYCNPGITLDKSLLIELAELNVEVDFDMYYLK